MIWIGKSGSIESVPVLISLWSRYPVPRSHLSGGSRSVVPSCECRSSIKVRFNQGCFGNVRTIPLSFHSSIALAQTSSQGILLVTDHYGCFHRFCWGIIYVWLYPSIRSLSWSFVSWSEDRYLSTVYQQVWTTTINLSSDFEHCSHSQQLLSSGFFTWMSEQYQSKIQSRLSWICTNN